MALFHHATYAASYTARSATWQATPLATPSAVSTRQRLDVGFQEQARESRNEISFACNAIMYEQYVILYYIVWAHLSGTQRTLDSAPRFFQADPDSSNTAHSGRRVLRSGGPNHSKPAVFIVFFQEIELVLTNPRVLTLWA